MSEPEKNAGTPKTPYRAVGLDVMGVAFELGFIIALPVAALALIGKDLDTHFHTHFIVFIGIVLALASSTAWLYLRIESLVARLQRSAEASRNPKNTKNE